MVPTRYGSSAMHSSTRPQRGSRITSSTGARPWWMPSARMDPPIAAPISATSSGSKAAPQASGVGKVAAFQTDRPVRHSSWTIAGMPSRVLVTSFALEVPQPGGPGAGVDGPGAVGPGEVAEAVAGEGVRGR